MEPTPRDIKTLLTVLRYHISKYGLDNGGMCEMIRERIPGSAISDTERQHLLEYLRVISPEDISTGTRSYWWPRGETAPRLKWLDEQIEDWNKRNEKAMVQSFLSDFNTTGMLKNWPLTPKEDEIDIPILEGYEIDKEKSSSGSIVLKRIKSELPKTWEELKRVIGHCVGKDSDIMRADCLVADHARNTWPTHKEARASIALAQLCQLRDRYNGGWKPSESDPGRPIYVPTHMGDVSCYVLTLKTSELRDEFVKNFSDLIRIAEPLLG